MDKKMFLYSLKIEENVYHYLKHEQANITVHSENYNFAMWIWTFLTAHKN